MRWLAFAALTAGMLLFGSATPLARLVTQDLPPLVGSALRVGLASLVLLPAATLGGFRWRSLERRDLVHAAALAVVGMFAFTVLLAFGMQRVPGVTGSVVMGTTPAVTALAAVLFLGERATWRRGVAVALAVAGVMLMRVQGEAADFDLVGVGLVFGAVLSEAVYTLVGKRFMARHDALATATVAAVGSMPLFLVAAAPQALAVEWGGLGAGTWAAVAFWGLGTMALGSLLWYWGVKRVEGHVAAPFMGLMPVSALVVSYLLLGEPARWWHAPGMGLVVAAIAVVVWDRLRG